MRRAYRSGLILSLWTLLFFAFGNVVHAGNTFGRLALIVGSRKFGMADGVSSEAAFRSPYSAVIVDNKLYVADSGNHSVREVDLTDKKVRTFTAAVLNEKDPDKMAGYKDGAIAWARFNRPMGITADPDGALYIADSENHCIRVIKDGFVSTFAGNGQSGYVDGQGRNARFNTPCDLAFLGEELYVTDSKNQAVRKIMPDGTVTTVLQGGDMIDPTGLYASDGVLYITDSGAQAVFSYTVSGGLKLLAGANTRYDEYIKCRIPGNQDGSVEIAKFNLPKGVYVKENRIYIADTWNSSIRLIKGKKVETYMLLRNRNFVVKPTKILFGKDGPIVVDVLNNQLLFYAE